MNTYKDRLSGSAQMSLGREDVSFPPKPSESGVSAPSPVHPGSLNDAALVRSVICDALKACKKSRAQIADEMSSLIGTSVTERMLNNFCADAREYRFPCEFERAFCAAVGDNRLLFCRVEAAGYQIIDQTGIDLLALGREHLRQKRAAMEVSHLEEKLSGVRL